MIVENNNVIVYYDTSLIRSILSHAGRGARSKCDKMPYKREHRFFYFATFSMTKNNLKLKTVKVEGFHPRSRLRSAATPQYPSKLKN
jgi:hypothetical protein